METAVTVREKKEFLQWFMAEYQTDAYDMNWFLQDLLENEQALQHIHFVENIADCPKGILLSIKQDNQLSFQFFKGNVKTNDVYTAYHELQLYRHDKCYLQVNFPDNHRNLLYKAVLEADAHFQKEIKLETEALLSTLLYKGKRTFIEKKINQSLEEGDYDRFMYYSKKLKELKQKGIDHREMEQG